MAFQNFRRVALSMLVIAPMVLALGDASGDSEFLTSLKQIDMSLDSTSRQLIASASDVDMTDYCVADANVDSSVFDTLTPDQREKEYGKLKTEKAKCVKDANGRTKFWGLPEVSKDLTEVNTIYKQVGTGAAGIGAGKETCEMLTKTEVDSLYISSAAPLRAIGANAEADMMKEHMMATYWNKRALYGRDGREQIAGDDRVCWEFAFAAIYNEFVIEVIVKKKSLNSFVKLQTLEKLGVYDEHIAHVSKIVEAGGAPDEVWVDHMVRNGTMSKTEREVLRGRRNETEVAEVEMDDAGEIDISVRSPGCHPICKRTLANMRIFDKLSYKSCCARCYGTWCRPRSETQTLLRFSNVYSLVKPRVTTRTARARPFIKRFSLWL